MTTVTYVRVCKLSCNMLQMGDVPAGFHGSTTRFSSGMSFKYLLFWAFTNMEATFSGIQFVSSSPGDILVCAPLCEKVYSTHVKHGYSVTSRLRFNCNTPVVLRVRTPESKTVTWQHYAVAITGLTVASYMTFRLRNCQSQVLNMSSIITKCSRHVRF